jgi:hypothetical protein
MPRMFTPSSRRWPAFLLAMLCCCLTAHAQENTRTTLSVSQFLQILGHAPADKPLLLQNLLIEPDPATDRLYTTPFRDNLPYWDSLCRTLDTIRVLPQVEWYNIEFKGRLVLPVLDFKQMVHLERITASDLFFRGCVFREITQNFHIDAYRFGFDHCRFEKGFYWEKINTVWFFFSNNQVEQFFQVFNTDAPINMGIYNSQFNCVQVSIHSEKGGELNLDNNQFLRPSVSAYVFLGGSGFFDFLSLSNCRFEGNFLLSNCSVKERLNIIRCHFEGFTAMNGLNAPEKNTNARWYQLCDQKLSIGTPDKVLFDGNTPLSKEKEDEFYNLIKIYFQFIRSYKYNGDEESYNACFIEMKDLLTRKSYFDWMTEGGFDNFAEWQLNRFLRSFCNYGVNPGKALFLSIFYIAIFGFVYLIFPPHKLPFEWADLIKRMFGPDTTLRQRWRALRLLLRQWLKACAFSMNAFVTLGYGKLTSQGMARYIAVAEGLLGWFLFSVFSASLISQILQQS